MSLRPPASAALLAQASSLGPDLAPLLAPPTREPTAEAETDPALTAQDLAQQGLPLGQSQEIVPADKLIDEGVVRSWKEVFTGEDASWRREATWWLSGFVVATVVRSACFHKSLFGSYLLENLAPVERDNPTWKYILAVRAWEIAAGGWVWRRVRGGLKGEGALFGALFALVTRISLYAFEHSYFLLSAQTVATLLLIDTLSLSTAFSLLPALLPSSPTARPGLSAYARLRSDPALVWNVVLGVGLAAFASAAVGYVVERLGGREFVKSQTMEGTVPSYLLREQLTTGEMLEHPTYTIPTLRTYDFPLSMPHHLFQSALTSLATLPFVSILPTLSPLRLALVTALLVALPSSLVLWDVLPVTPLCAASVGVALAARAAWSAGVIGWVIEELRKEKKVRKVKLLLVDEETDEVLAVSEARVEEDAEGAGSMAKKDRAGVTHRRGVVKGEIEL
ncbi:hypothetical protein JCM11251_003492 [Rhodosporidiobolus azoricus]